MSSCRKHLRGFTLIEVMVVVFIVGILAALCIYAVQRHLAGAKSAEAKNAVGHISRAATAAYEREQAESEKLAEGADSQGVSHELCDSADAVPATVPQGRKYQPSTQEGTDYDTGDPKIGWKCLRFRISQPTYYQYKYTRGSSPMAPNNVAACQSGVCFEAGARGDLNANGMFSAFARTGEVNSATGQLKASTQIYVEAEDE